MNVAMRFVVLWLSLFVLGCASTHPQAAVEAPWRDANEVEGSTGLFVVRYLARPAAIPMNEDFALRACIFDARERERPLDDVELVVDAGMPEHKHGMVRVPRIERHDDGSFEIRGMLFHMPGRWELYFDVVRGALTERAQVSVELE
jgi:hypothetical protein